LSAIEQILPSIIYIVPYIFFELLLESINGGEYIGILKPHYYETLQDRVRINGVCGYVHDFLQEEKY
jgi:hypothetical protein